MPTARDGVYAGVTTDDLERLLGAERDAEGMLLRGHLLVERELMRLLAARLEVSIDQLPARLSFELLARLAFCGSRYDKPRSALLTLNAARNRMAHSLKYDSAAARNELAPLINEAKTRMAVAFGESPIDFAHEIRVVVVATIALILDEHISLLTSKNELLDDVRELHENLVHELRREKSDLENQRGKLATDNGQHI